VRALVLVEAPCVGLINAFADEEAQAQVAQVAALTPDEAGTITADPRWMESLFDALMGPGTHAAMSPRARAGLLENKATIYAEARACAHDTTRGEVYAGISQPTLVVSGTQTRRMWQVSSGLLADCVTNVSRVTVAGAGHLAPLTHYKVVACLVDGHLAHAEIAALALSA
jgi:pimeloyl-ACP methyl ester carboxylesterase